VILIYLLCKHAILSDWYFSIKQGESVDD